MILQFCECFQNSVFVHTECCRFDFFNKGKSFHHPIWLIVAFHAAQIGHCRTAVPPIAYPIQYGSQQHTNYLINCVFAHRQTGF